MLKKQLTASLKNEEVIRKKNITLKSTKSPKAVTCSVNLIKKFSPDRKKKRQ